MAANLYNRGVPLQLLNVSVWGMLALVSRTPGRHTLADFKGEEIAMPFRADMPDILFQLLARAQGWTRSAISSCVMWPRPWMQRNC